MMPDFFILFSFPGTANHERDWPPCKVVLFWSATNTMSVRSNNNNNMLVIRWSPVTSPFVLIFRSKRVDRGFLYCARGVSRSRSPEIAHVGTLPTCFPLTSLCGLPLLFVYFQVNTGVSYFLDNGEDIYDGGPLCPGFNPEPVPYVFTTTTSCVMPHPPCCHKCNT